MGWIKKTGLALGGLIILGALGGYIWFWGKPVGVNNYINKASIKMATDSPELLTYIGLIDNTPLDFHSGKLADYTKAQDDKSLEKLKAAQKGFFEDQLNDAEFEYSGYPISQLSGPTVNLPQFLTDTHAIKSRKSIERYLSRVGEFGRVLGEMKTRVEDYRDNGVVAPDFIIEKVLVGLRSFIEDGAAENPLVKTLPARLDKVDGLSQDQKDDYVTRAQELVETKIIPGYEAMITLHEELLKTANSDAGIWRIPNGDKIYAAALRSNTTTDYTADEIHNTGLSEVTRIEAEMETILTGEGLTDGTVTSRVQTLMQDPDQIFPNTDEGRADMIAFLEQINENIMNKAGDYFITLPPQELEILRIPEYSQDGAPGGYYNTADNPKWTLPTLLYHEAAPGHHFQISRAMLIKKVPILRKMSPFTAYTEGWALYAERIAAQDMGLYENKPLWDLGRLQAEMFRAVRLVVDTGIHHKRWTREQAIDYMMSKTGMTEAEVTREIERYIVWPGQATAYKTGQLAILDMRARAEAGLGTDFNLRNFNEMILENGAMPLGILGEVVDEWIEKTKTG